MSETLIFVLIFAIIMFFMHRGHGAHGGSGMGCCGGHSQDSQTTHTHKGDENKITEKGNEH